MNRKRRRAIPSLILGDNLVARLGLTGCPVVRSAGEVAQLFEDLTKLQREILVLGGVDSQLRLLHWDLLAVGAHDHVFLRVGEVFQTPLREGAHGIFLVHNHPSGSLRPSLADRQLTRLVAETGAGLGCPLFDHVIVSREGYASLMTRALIRLQEPDQDLRRAAERKRNYRYKAANH
ncbi:MAG: JAB domain-containing protein [Planctomycetota bacterium]|nr:JAB domain-containing protein [Planctomycetota bacterium]